MIEGWLAENKTLEKRFGKKKLSKKIEKKSSLKKIGKNTAKPKKTAQDFR